jgi:hypothetical protein
MGKPKKDKEKLKRRMNMPRGNGTGPMGMGPMTGRGAGYCAGNTTPGYASGFGFGAGRGFGSGFGAGRGFGSGFGAGRGYRNRFFATGVPGWAATAAPAAVDEKAFLKNQSDFLENQLQQIKKRITELGESAE